MTATDLQGYTEKLVEALRVAIDLYRDAFNVLFDAARMAVQCFLATDETRWGTLARRLPPDLEQRFHAIMNFSIAAISRRTTLGANLPTGGKLSPNSLTTWNQAKGKRREI